MSLPLLVGEMYILPVRALGCFFDETDISAMPMEAVLLLDLGHGCCWCFSSEHKRDTHLALYLCQIVIVPLHLSVCI